MRKGVMVAIPVVVIVCTGAWWFWVHNARGFSANAKPTWIEAELAKLSRSLALPGRQSDMKNPYPPTPERLAAARKLYHSQCEICHSANGDGDTAIGRSMYPKVTDLRGLVQNKTDGVLFYEIRNGIRMSGMPAWSRQDTSRQIWGLVDLIRTMRLQPGTQASVGAAATRSR